MAESLKILVVGAAGPSAGLVVPELKRRNSVVRGLVHKPEEEETARACGAAETVVGDLADAAAVAKALDGQDAAFYIAPVEIENEAKVGTDFVDAAKSAGVRRVVFSSVIHPVLSELANHAAKAPVEEALLDSGLEYVFLHPALFYQNFASSWAKVKETGEYGEPWSPESRFTRVDYRDVAQVAAMALTEDHLLYGTFELGAEGNLNRHEVAALMADVLGRSVKVTTPRPVDASGKLSRMFEWYDKHSLLGSAVTLTAILGRPPRTLRAYFEQLRARDSMHPCGH